MMSTKEFAERCHISAKQGTPKLKPDEIEYLRSIVFLITKARDKQIIERIDSLKEMFWDNTQVYSELQRMKEDILE